MVPSVFCLFVAAFLWLLMKAPKMLLFEGPRRYFQVIQVTAKFAFQPNRTVELKPFHHHQVLPNYSRHRISSEVNETFFASFFFAADATELDTTQSWRSAEAGPCALVPEREKFKFINRGNVDGSKKHDAVRQPSHLNKFGHRTAEMNNMTLLKVNKQLT